MILDFFSCCGTVASVMAAQNNIMLNGIPYELTEPCSVSRLLESAAEAPEAESPPAFKCRNMSYIPRIWLSESPAIF